MINTSNGINNDNNNDDDDDNTNNNINIEQQLSRQPGDVKTLSSVVLSFLSLSLSLLCLLSLLLSL